MVTVSPKLKILQPRYSISFSIIKHNFIIYKCPCTLVGVLREKVILR